MVQSKTQHCFYSVLPIKINLNSQPLFILWTNGLDIYSVSYTVLQELNKHIYNKIYIHIYN